jgi:hypothetical protein
MAAMSQFPRLSIKLTATNPLITSEGWREAAEFLESTPHDELKQIVLLDQGTSTGDG